MNIPLEIILAFSIGLVVIAFIGYLLLVPRRFLWRLAAGGVLGAISLGIVNLFSGITGISANINPFSALLVGLLGLPGALMILILSNSSL